MQPELNEDDWVLPALRQDLQVQSGTSKPEGTPTWTIYDPIANRFFQVGWLHYQMLSHWSCWTAERLVQAMQLNTPQNITLDDVQQFVQFLTKNHLTMEPEGDVSRTFAALADKSKTPWWTWLVHKYLFFRIPVVNPQPFLQATLRYVTPFFSPIAGWLLLLCTLLGLILVIRRWDDFTHTFLHFFSFSGFFAYLVALFVVKVMHELGHAYTATRYGCRVPVMGVALLVMMPLLYTDTTDSWKLSSRSQRLRIAAAGSIVELALASLATVMWAILPPGITQSIAFVVATISWVLTLAINLNPLLKFDGYYMLSDWWGVPNLQDRAFALGQWQLRSMLWGIEQPLPESLRSSLRRKLIVYAWACWVYRFFLFLGIAMLVYYVCFKLLGILLFAIEIGWFLLLPLAREIRAWWNLRSSIRSPYRACVTLIVIVGCVVAMMIPWHTRVTLPAVLASTHHTQLFAPVPAQIVHVNLTDGQRVEIDEHLLTLRSPQLEERIALVRHRLSRLKIRRLRHVASPHELVQHHVTEEQERTLTAQLQGLLKQQQQLTVRASFAGQLTDVVPALHSGRWIHDSLPLATLMTSQHGKVHAMAQALDLQRLTVGQSGDFIPEALTQSRLGVVIEEIRLVDEPSLPFPDLASQFGGPIPVRPGNNGELHPITSVYRVTLRPTKKSVHIAQMLRGHIHISGHATSLLQRLWTSVVATVVRESGF